MHQAIASALVATPALAYITTCICQNTPLQGLTFPKMNLVLEIRQSRSWQCLGKTISQHLLRAPHTASLSSAAHVYALTGQWRSEFTARRFALLLSPHSVGFFAVTLKSVHNCLIHMSSLAALLIAISCRLTPLIQLID